MHSSPCITSVFLPSHRTCVSMMVVFQANTLAPPPIYRLGLSYPLPRTLGWSSRLAHSISRAWCFPHSAPCRRACRCGSHQQPHEVLGVALDADRDTVRRAFRSKARMRRHTVRGATDSYLL